MIVGVDTIQTNLHLGTPDQHWSNSTLKTDRNENFADQFHIYELLWTEQYLAFNIGKIICKIHLRVDNRVVKMVKRSTD